MAAGYTFLGSGRCSLLMEHTSKRSDQEHIVLNVSTGNTTVSVDVATLSEQETPSRSTQAPSWPVPSSSFLSNTSSPYASSLQIRLRRQPQFNSHRYISIEITITVIHIIASIAVLALSRNENRHALLTAWIVGYASGCLATLPHLYLRYRRRLCEFVELFEFALQCFFVVWIALGIALIDGHLPSSDAPNQYRLCIAFVALSYIGLAIKIIICASPLCCLPCVISLLGDWEDQTQTRGASFEIVGALPKYKFKAKKSTEGNGSKDDCENPSESSGEDDIIAVGTERERPVSAKDAMCCICLRKYKDDEHLRELPCAHYFHLECVDKWLKINASCPLCKHEIRESSEAASESVGDIRQNGNV